MHSPARISVSRSKGVTVDWRDGHRSHYELKYLRARCPCAACAAAPQAGDSSPFVIYEPALRIESMETAGAYALRIAWSDGHSTGIYSFEHLRRICPCAECARLSA